MRKASTHARAREEAERKQASVTMQAARAVVQPKLRCPTTMAGDRLADGSHWHQGQALY